MNIKNNVLSKINSVEKQKMICFKLPESIISEFRSECKKNKIQQSKVVKELIKLYLDKK